jgi:hypothetical protein
MPSETHADGIDGTVAVVQLDDADEVLKLFGGKVRDGLSGYPHHANGRDVTDGEAEVRPASSPDGQPRSRCFARGRGGHGTTPHSTR